MIRLNNRMMFPEPEDVGGGSTEVSTYSLDSAPDEEEEAVQEAPGTPDVEGAADTPEQAPPPPEYTLTFEEADNINADY